METISSILRAGPEYRTHGDPYRVAVAVRWIDPQTVEILGLDVKPTLDEWRAMRDVLRKAGVRTIRFVRKKSDGDIWHEVK